MTAEEVLIWKAPEGMLAAEVGLQAEFAAEAAVEKNIRKVRLHLGFLGVESRCENLHTQAQV